MRITIKNADSLVFPLLQIISYDKLDICDSGNEGAFHTDRSQSRNS